MRRNVYLLLMILLLAVAASSLVRELECFYKVGYSKNGQKKPGDELSDGELRGKWTYSCWYENGQKKREGGFNDGKSNGKWTWWDENGRVVKETEYRDGVQIK